MNAKHTQGPWHINEEIGADESKGIAPFLAFHSIRDSNNEFIVITCGEPNEANARLIAAAPELLEALEEVFVIGDRLVDDVYGHEFVEKARAAIAKATGA